MRAVPLEPNATEHVDEGQLPRIIVMGIGNILLGDEGVGVRAIERLRNEYVIPADVEVIDGGTAGIDLLPYIRKDSSLLIVDAVKPRRDAPPSPGRFMRLENDQVPAFLASKISPHQLGLSDLLAAAHLVDRKPERLVFLGIEPKNIDTGLELTPEIEARMDALMETILAELRGLGVELRRAAHV